MVAAGTTLMKESGLDLPGCHAQYITQISDLLHVPWILKFDQIAGVVGGKPKEEIREHRPHREWPA